MNEDSSAQIVLIVDLTEDALLEVTLANWALDQDNLLQRMLTNIELIVTEHILCMFSLDGRSEVPLP